MEARKQAIELVDRLLNEDKVVSLLVWLTKTYSKETYHHLVNVAEITAEILIRRGCREYELYEVTKGALLHDIGKISVPKNILNTPNCLTADEMFIMKNHPVEGLLYLIKMDEVFSDSYVSNIVKDIVYMHHERRDGSGYPEGVDDIPWYVELVSAVDAYEAMRAARCYGKAKSHEEAIETLRKDNYEDVYISDIKSLVETHMEKIISFAKSATLEDLFILYDIFGYEFSINDGEINGAQRLES